MYSLVFVFVRGFVWCFWNGGEERGLLLFWIAMLINPAEGFCFNRKGPPVWVRYDVIDARCLRKIRVVARGERKEKGG